MKKSKLIVLITLICASVALLTVIIAFGIITSDDDKFKDVLIPTQSSESAIIDSIPMPEPIPVPIPEDKTIRLLAVGDNLFHAGSDTVRAEVTVLPAGFEIPRNFERIELSVASPRLDGVVRALTGLSRADANALVKAADVELNYFPEENADAPVSDGDTLSIRGYGKYIIDSACGVTRRGRNRLSARKYV